MTIGFMTWTDTCQKHSNTLIGLDLNWSQHQTSNPRCFVWRVHGGCRTCACHSSPAARTCLDVASYAIQHIEGPWAQLHRKVNLGAVPENGGAWGIPPRNLLKLPMYANLLGPGKMIKQFEHLDLSLILEKSSKTGDALDKVQLGLSPSLRFRRYDTLGTTSCHLLQALVDRGPFPCPRQRSKFDSSVCLKIRHSQIQRLFIWFHHCISLP